MTKFDQVLNELTNNMNPVNPANQVQQTQNPAQPNTQVKPGTPVQTTTQTNQVNKPGQPVVNNNQQKPNFDQLMKDFNDPNKSLDNLTDLKNYGINIDQK